MTTEPLPQWPAPSDVPGGRRVAGLPAHVVIRQLYLGCLSQASYVVGDGATGRGIVVDPRRDVDEMLATAAAEGLAIELIVETHFHADFLSGHLELSAATGAEIGIGAAGTTDYRSRRLHDGERIDLGGVKIEVWATPGHTPESISLVVFPGAGADPVAVLTGDTLFIGDVGRPDLLATAELPVEALGRQLYRSVHRLLELPDDTVLLPAHGAGSACGKALSTETVSTIGEQRRTNYALQPMGEDAFVALVTEGQSEPPAYFGHDAQLNRQAHPLLDEHQPPPPLTLDGLDEAVSQGAVVIDTRPADDFANGHLIRAINVSLTGRFAEQVGSLVPFDAPIVLVGSPSAVLEGRLRLGRIGFDRVVGAFAEPEAVIAAHPERSARSSRLTADDLAARRVELGDRLQLIDVRSPGEVAAAPVAQARNIPLNQLRRRLEEVDRNRPVVLVCAGGARSAIASSVLTAAGFVDVSDVIGGAAAIASSPAMSGP